MKRILNIATPRIRCYQHYAFPMGIINYNLQDSSYLYNLFIRLVYRRNGDTSIEFDIPYYFSHIPNFFSEEGLIIPGIIQFPIVQCEKIDIINYIKQCIDRDTYVSGIWNEYFIHGKEAYQKYNFDRNYLIYGYDDTEKCFFSAGYLGKNFWSNKFKIDYDIFIDSLIIRNKFIYLYTYIYNNAFKLSINLPRIQNEVIDYLNSKSLIDNNKDYSYGIQANRDYFANLQFNVEKKGDLVLPPLYALFEHKNFMFERLLYLKNAGAIKVAKSKLEDYNKIVNTYHNLLNMGIKYKIIRRLDLIKEITLIGSEAIDRENQILRLVFPDIL